MSNIISIKVNHGSGCTLIGGCLVEDFKALITVPSSTLENGSVITALPFLLFETDA